MLNKRNVVYLLLLVLVLTGCSTKRTSSDGLYLSFLKENSYEDWHIMWEQLWNLSDTVTIPKSVLSLYPDDTAAADKIVENIVSYGFWVDDKGTNGQYMFKYTANKIELLGIKYYPEATQMKADVEFALQAIYTDVYVKDDPLATLENINKHLYYITEYSEDSVGQGQTIYSALIDRRAVCGGFARTFNTLALLSGIDSQIAVGYLVTPNAVSGDNIKHAWNTYVVDDVYYIADTTRNRTNGVIRKVINHPIDESYYSSYKDIQVYAEAVRKKR